MAIYVAQMIGHYFHIKFTLWIFFLKCSILGQSSGLFWQPFCWPGEKYGKQKTKLHHVWRRVRVAVGRMSNKVKRTKLGLQGLEVSAQDLACLGMCFLFLSIYGKYPLD